MRPHVDLTPQMHAVWQPAGGISSVREVALEDFGISLGDLSAVDLSARVLNPDDPQWFGEELRSVFYFSVVNEVAEAA